MSFAVVARPVRARFRASARSRIPRSAMSATLMSGVRPLTWPLEPTVAWRRAILFGALAGTIGAALLWLGPPGADTAAHVYQRDLFRSEGFVTWDNYWYSGRHVFVTYSWLYYPLASLVGIKLLAALSLAVAAAAFAHLVRWTPAVLTFAAVWGLYALSGAYPFMLGVAFALLALVSRRWWAFGPLAVLAWAASPLAVLLLAVVLVGARRWRPLAFVLALIAFQIVLAHLYHGRGHFPFPWGELIAALVFAGGGTIVARSPQVRRFFGAYLAFVLLAFAFQSQLGENAARLRYMAIPLSLLAVRGRPLWVGVPLVALCVSYNLSPLTWNFVKGADERANHRSYWAPALAFLRAHRDPNFRVNALYTVGLNRKTYVRWLHERGVRYVLVPDDRLDYSSKREAEVAAKLHFVTRRGDVSIYEAPRPVPIAPGATIMRLTHERVTL